MDLPIRTRLAVDGDWFVGRKGHVKPMLVAALPDCVSVHQLGRDAGALPSRTS